MRDHPLNKYTYLVRHQPNCPKPFQVVTAGAALLVSHEDPLCLFAYGNTLQETMDRAYAQVRAFEIIKGQAWGMQIDEAGRYARQVLRLIESSGHKLVPATEEKQDE